MENNTLKEFTSQLLPGIAISFCWDLIKHIFNVLWQKKNNHCIHHKCFGHFLDNTSANYYYRIHYFKYQTNKITLIISSSTTV